MIEPVNDNNFNQKRTTVPKESANKLISNNNIKNMHSNIQSNMKARNNQKELTVNPSKLESKNILKKIDTANTVIVKQNIPNNHNYLNTAINHNEKYNNNLNNLNSNNNSNSNNTPFTRNQNQNNTKITNANRSSNKSKDKLGSLFSNHNSKVKNNSRKIYINNPKLNKRKFNYPDNYVKTSKYTWINFFPKALLLQFNRLANVYFLLIAIVQTITILSPLNPSTAWAPFIVVIGVSIIREGVEEYSRKKSDVKENSILAVRYNSSNKNMQIWEETKSKNLEVGDIVKIKKNSVIPADLLLLSCSNSTKIAYIETATLDGEKNLKPKYCINQTFNIMKNINSLVRVRGSIVCNNPAIELNKFNGTVYFNFLHTYSFEVSQFLYKGTFVRNTEWVVGVVIYTGSETKIILNSQKGSNKQSNLEKKVNIIISFIFSIQCLLCLILAIMNSFWTYENNNPDPKLPQNNKHLYLENKYSSSFFGFISFFSYLLLLNTLIPISLVVSIEIVKYAQGYFMSVDVNMYSQVKNRYAQPNSVSLNEELGQIKYIFSDKTGTLTANKLQFRAAVIGNLFFSCVSSNNSNKSGSIPQTPLKTKNNNNKEINNLNNNNESEFDYESLKDYTIRGQRGTTYNIEFPECNNNSITIMNDKEAISHFMSCLVLNHSCMVEKKLKNPEPQVSKKMTRNEFKKLYKSPNSKNLEEANITEVFDILYKGESPDEIILVETAKNAGMIYLGGNKTEALVRYMKDYNGSSMIGENTKFKILRILEYTSERAMMSVIIALPNGDIVLYSKGSDSKIKELASKRQYFSEHVESRAKILSESGLRVLWIAMKALSKNDYEKWERNLEMEIAKTTDDELVKNIKYSEYRKIESNLTILGCSAVEDKLQDNVPETIKTLQTAGINIWVLTGDNLPTAKNIGIMCGLIDNQNNMEVFELFENEKRFKLTCDPTLEIFNEDALSQAKSIIKEFESNVEHRELKKTYQDSNLKFKSILYVGLINLLKKYNHIGEENETYNNNNNHNHNSSQKIKLKKGILVEKGILVYVLPLDSQQNIKYYAHPLSKLFLELTLNSHVVICCRVAPKQKALVVRMIKRNIKNAITLSIGDGANDVSMIIEADVGVGIYGEEGTQAAMASDYAIGEFQCLNRLILVHGRINYLRIAEMILYFFYKNFLFTIPQFYFAFFNSFSGITLYDEWFVSLYNVIFTSLPLLCKALIRKRRSRKRR